MRELGLLPTPTARDERMDVWSPAYEKRKSPSIDALSHKHGRTGTADLLGLVEWMLGYPPGWLSSVAINAELMDGKTSRRKRAASL